jgi:hypothetical protein
MGPSPGREMPVLARSKLASGAAIIGQLATAIDPAVQGTRLRDYRAQIPGSHGPRVRCVRALAMAAPDRAFGAHGGREPLGAPGRPNRRFVASPTAVHAG